MEGSQLKMDSHWFLMAPSNMHFPKETGGEPPHHCWHSHVAHSDHDVLASCAKWGYRVILLQMTYVLGCMICLDRC